MIIREARIDEMLEASTILASFQKHTDFVTVIPEVAAKSYTDFVNRGIGGMLLAISENKVIGGLGYLIANDIHCGKKYAVESFWFMLPEYRGGGIRLLARFEEIARERDCEECAMIHLSDSFPERLEHLYIRRGYRMVEKHYIKRLKP
jgi:GNAT superfamily N-acetyltransferase